MGPHDGREQAQTRQIGSTGTRTPPLASPTSPSSTTADRHQPRPHGAATNTPLPAHGDGGARGRRHLSGRTALGWRKQSPLSSPPQRMPCPARGRKAPRPPGTSLVCGTGRKRDVTSPTGTRGPARAGSGKQTEGSINQQRPGSEGSKRHSFVSTAWQGAAVSADPALRAPAASSRTGDASSHPGTGHDPSQRAGSVLQEAALLLSGGY